MGWWKSFLERRGVEFETDSPEMTSYGHHTHEHQTHTEEEKKKSGGLSVGFFALCLLGSGAFYMSTLRGCEPIRRAVEENSLALKIKAIINDKQAPAAEKQGPAR